MLKVNPVTHSYVVSSICKCCGLFGMLGQTGAAAIQAATDITTQSMANRTNKEIAEKTNETNLKLNEANNRQNWLINEATNNMNKLIAEEANQTNLAIMEGQNNFNYNMWKEELAYNDPSAQMERLIAAGINPNMVNSSSGAAIAGNSNGYPESASYAGAQVAHMNPIQLEAGHVDPYKVAAINADFLPALQAAAGIANTMADTRSKELKNDFDFSTLDTREEMETTKAQIMMEQLKDFQGSSGYRSSIRAIDVDTRRYLRDLNKGYVRQINQVIKQRMDEWKWAKSLRPDKERKLVAEINKINKEVESMDATMIFQKAQAAHWVREDEINKHLADLQDPNLNPNLKEQINLELQKVRNSIRFEKIDQILKGYDLDIPQRRSFALALAASGENEIASAIYGLKGAAKGTYNSWFQYYTRKFQNDEQDLFNNLYTSPLQDFDTHVNDFGIDTYGGGIR